MKIPGWISKIVQIPPSAKWDIVLLPALFFFNLFNFSAWFHLGQAPAHPWLILPWLYGLVVLFLLAWRNKAPIISFVAQWVLTMAAWPFMFMVEYIPVVGIPVTLYTLSFHRGRKASAPALVASFIPSALGAYFATFKISHSVLSTELVILFIFNFFFFAAMAVGAWFLGGWIAISQRHRQYLEREQQTAREAEVLAEERRKIAREMHDIVSHSVAVILLQAKAAACVADTDFTEITDTKFIEIKQSLAHITTVGTQTMAELRRLLRVLESGDTIHHDLGPNELKPQPGLTELPTLLTSLRDAGMPVTAHVKGTQRDLDPSVDLAAYRIVQEGLINILKHVGEDANPRLWLIWNSQSLLIQIDNDLNSSSRKSTLSAGRGIVGLRERVRAVGGNLNAGSYKGGYRLIATLPLSTPEISLDSGVSSQPHDNQGKVSV